MKNKIRKIHIDTEVWSYVIDSNEVRIYDIDMILYRVNISDIGEVVFDNYIDKTFSIKPSLIKKYIIDEIKKNSCPECGKPLIAQMSGGVKCSKCDYWFCY